MVRRVPLPCATKLRLLLSYNEETGRLHWRKSARRGYKPGDAAGCFHKPSGYVHVVLGGIKYYAHRLIWKIKTGQEPPHFIDHADANKANNLWANLRAATPSQNGYNRKLHKNNKTGTRGVHWDAGHRAWKASIKVDRKLIVLGLFPNVDDAASAVNSVRPKFHQEFARAS